MATKVLVRNCAHSEISLLVKMASVDGRNPGLNDADLFSRVDPNGFFIAIQDNNVVGSISAVNYGSDFGFIGLHFVLPEFQNTDVEEKLLETALQKLINKTIGLNCYESQSEYYIKHGFKPSHKILTYEGIANGQTFSDNNIISPFMHPLELLLDIDGKYFAYDRKDLLTVWLQQPQSLLLAKMMDGAYSGYGLFSPSAKGYKVSPLVCEDLVTAEQLLRAFVSHMKAGSRFFIDLPDSNKEAVKLAEKLNMEKIDETVRMYLKSEPEISLNNVFSFTNYELG